MRPAFVLLALAACVEDRPAAELTPTPGGDGGATAEGGAPAPAAPLAIVDRFHVAIYDRRVEALRCVDDARIAMEGMTGGGYSSPVAAEGGGGWMSKRPGAALYAGCRPDPEGAGAGAILVVGAWGVLDASNPVNDQGRLAALAQEQSGAGPVSEPRADFPELATADLAMVAAFEHDACVQRAADALSPRFPATEGGTVFKAADTVAIAWRPGRTVSVTCVGKPRVKAILFHGFAADKAVDLKALLEDVRGRVVNPP